MQFRSTCKLNTVILMKILYFYFFTFFKNNLRINGVKEEYGETLETSETKMQQILKEKLEIDKEIVIGCA